MSDKIQGTILDLSALPFMRQLDEYDFRTQRALDHPLFAVWVKFRFSGAGRVALENRALFYLAG